MSKKSLGRMRNNGGLEELDVFEAAKYFSDSNEVSTSGHKNHLHGRTWGGGGGRRSLDITMQLRKSSLPGRNPWAVGDVELLDNKKQPSSPGGKLASFLNSLFNQTRKKSKAGKEEEDYDDESPGGGRSSRRRWLGVKTSRSSSSTTTTCGTNLSSGCGFRTPPPTYTYAPTKSYIFSNLHSEQATNNVPKNHKSISCFVRNAFRSNSTRKEKHPGKTRTKMNDDDEDDDYSETSSDLFDLPSSELMKGLYSTSSGLPVYQTTQMDCIKKSNNNAPV